ncbi:hypothetical protein [Myxococcus qinghaiensis]|uniref:hypothetical protein n=1 Tax=Myxococcus qinghaiensis TaxID=2906758 RepID=UPI0020A7E89E|nr:hypothetical protein [Myxococcus qinghaiensis]MCP3168975.1 hypothetical protein [Myxococcus qinghaiensis]
MTFDIDRFRVEKRYRNTAPVSELMEDLGVLTVFDAEMNVFKHRWQRRAFIVGGVGAGLFVLSKLLDNVLDSELTPKLTDGLLLASIGLLVVMVVFLVRASRFGRCDLENRRYELPSSLLRRLGRDIAPEEPVSLELDFQPIDHKAKWTRKGMAGTWTTNEFEDPWLSLQARLRDGTHLRLSMTEWLQKRSRTRSNGRGKYKTKYKQKSGTYLQAQLRVKPERHPGLGQLEKAAREAVKLPPTVALTRLEVSDDRLGLRARMDSDWEANADVESPGQDATRTCLMMLLSLYQVLNFSTSQRKQLPARASR